MRTVHVLHVTRWQRIQAIVWLGAGLVVAGSGSTSASMPLIVASGTLVSYGCLFALISARRPADWVTLARVCALAGAMVLANRSERVEPGVWCLCALAIAADLVDGWLARRTGGSAAGAVLDMEADQTATLGLAVLAVVPCGVGAWALLLPAFRYTFVLLGWLAALPAHDPKPKAGDNRRARAICALAMVLQLAAIAPFTPSAIRAVCIATAIAAFTYSYSDDVQFLLRHRAAAP